MARPSQGLWGRQSRERGGKVGKKENTERKESNYQPYLRVPFLLSEVKRRTKATPLFTPTLRGDPGTERVAALTAGQVINLYVPLPESVDRLTTSLTK